MIASPQQVAAGIGRHSFQSRMEIPDSIICAFSRGKDSLAVLDICVRRFKRVEAFYMYWVKGLEFEEAILRYVENRYSIKIYRVPHFELARLVSRQALTWYRPSAPEFRITKQRDIDDHVRRHFGNEIPWIASGERKMDSLERRAMLSASGEWDTARMHYYPIMEWKTRHVWDYMQMHNLPVPAEYGFLKRSWAGLVGPDLYAIREHFPSDYRKILEVFPFAAAITARYEFHADRTPKKRHSKSGSPNGESIADSHGGLQSTPD